MSLNFLSEFGQNQVAGTEIVTAAVHYDRGTHRLWYDQVVEYLNWGLLFLIPIFFLPWTTSVVEFNKQMLLVSVVSVGLVVWLLKTVSFGQLVWRNSPLHLGVAAVALGYGISTILSLTRFKSTFGLAGSLSSSLLSVLAVAVFYYLVVSNTHDGGLQRLVKILKWSLLAALVFGVLQMLTVYVVQLPFAMSRAFSTVGTLNVLGILGAVALPLFIRSGKSLIDRITNSIGIAAALAVLVILNWWVLWVVAIAGMAALIGISVSSEGKFKILKLVVPLFIIVLAVFLLLIKFEVRPIKNQLPVEIAPSYQLSWSIASSVIKDKFLTGYGPENFSMAFDKYGASRISNTTVSNAKFMDATSEFFNTIIHGGIVLLAAVAYLLWSLCRMFMRFVTKKPSSSDVAVALWSGMIALVVAFFLYPFNLTLLFLFFAFMALVTLSQGDSAKVINIENKPSWSLASSLGFVVGLIVVLVTMYYATSIYAADVKYARLSTIKTNDDLAKEISSVVNWNSSSDLYYRSASQVALRLLADEINKQPDPKDVQRNTRIQNYTASAVNLAQRATTLNPYESQNWENLGDVHQQLLGIVNGAEVNAEQAYQKAAELRPGDALYDHKIGSMFLSKGDVLANLSSRAQNASQFIDEAKKSYAKAEESFKKAIGLSSNYGLAIYNLGVVYDREGKLGEAIQQLEKIIPFNTDKPNMFFELGLLYYRVGAKDKAQAALEQAVILAPNYSNARWYLALILEEKKDIDGAIAQLDEILAIKENENNQTVLTKLNDLKSGKTAIPPQKVTDQKPL